MDCYSKQFLLALSSFFKSLVPVGAEKLAGVCFANSVVCGMILLDFPAWYYRISTQFFVVVGICEQAVEIEPETVFQNLDLKEFEVDVGKYKCTLLYPFSLPAGRNFFRVYLSFCSSVNQYRSWFSLALKDKLPQWRKNIEII